MTPFKRPRKPHKPPHPHPVHPPADHVTHAELSKAISQTRALEQADVQGLSARVARLEADVVDLQVQLSAMDERVSILEMLVS